MKCEDKMPRCNALAQTGRRCRNHSVISPKDTDESCMFCVVHTAVQERAGPIPRVERPNPIGMCSICLDDVVPPYDAMIKTCSHVFHAKCITGWFNKNNLTCPYCRTVTDEDSFNAAYKRTPGRKLDPYMVRVHYVLSRLKHAMRSIHMDPSTSYNEDTIVQAFETTLCLHPVRTSLERLRGFEKIANAFIETIERDRNDGDVLMTDSVEYAARVPLPTSFTS